MQGWVNAKITAVCRGRVKASAQGSRGERCCEESVSAWWSNLEQPHERASSTGTGRSSKSTGCYYGRGLNGSLRNTDCFLTAAGIARMDLDMKRLVGFLWESSLEKPTYHATGVLFNICQYFPLNGGFRKHSNAVKCVQKCWRCLSKTAPLVSFQTVGWKKHDQKDH